MIERHNLRWWETVSEFFSEAGRTRRRQAKRADSAPKEKPLGLALGSGGLRGGAHVGVLQVLSEHNIRPSLLAGTSAGSVVAVLQAAGLNPAQLMEAANQLTPQLFTDLTVSKYQLLAVGARALRDYLGTSKHERRRQTSGLIRGERFGSWLRRIVGTRHFDELLLPTYVVATDFVRGECVVFGPEQPKLTLPAGYAYVTGVDVVTAVRASSAIPLIFEPIQVGERLLVDGAFAEPVPVSVLHRAGAERIIAVDLTSFSSATPQIGSRHCYNLFDVLGRATALLTDRYSDLRLSQFADVVLRPTVESSGLTDVSTLQKHIESGRHAANQALNLLKTAS